MDKFIDTPYRPLGKVTLAAGGFAPPGIKVIPPPDIAALPLPIRRHADLGLCPIGGSEIVCPPDSYAYYTEALSPYGFSIICGGQRLNGSYPEDTAYNVVVAGNFALLNPKACDGTLLKLIENRFEILPVKQGYAKCSVCPISENAIISADAGICRIAERYGLEALKISNDGVELPPYGNGFFGGATGMVSKDVLAVNGCLAKMRSGTEILNFLKNHSVKPLEMNSFAPFDTGSLIPLLITEDNIK